MWAEFKTLLSFFFSILFPVFLLSCSSVWFSMDLKHILVHCHPLHILGAELFLSRRGWNVPISLQLSDYNLWPRWPRKVMHCGVPLRGSLTIQQLSFTCLLSISSSQNKAQGRGEKTGKKRKGCKGIKWGNEEQRRDEPYPHPLQRLLLTASW